MFDIGWSEMAVIMLVALIVIGPKDLPKVARTVGRWTGRARALARDFQRSLDDMAREAELDEIKKTIEKAGSTNLRSAIGDAIDPDRELEHAFDVEAKPKRTNVGKPGLKAPAAAPERAAPALPAHAPAAAAEPDAAPTPVPESATAPRS